MGLETWLSGSGCLAIPEKTWGWLLATTSGSLQPPVIPTSWSLSLQVSTGTHTHVHSSIHRHTLTYRIKTSWKCLPGADEMSQMVKVLAAKPNDLNLIPEPKFTPTNCPLNSTTKPRHTPHIHTFTHHYSSQLSVCKFSSLGSNTFFWPPWVPGMKVVHRSTCR